MDKIMKNLTVVENVEEFIPIYETDKGEKVVSGEELYEGLGVSSKTQMSDWIKNQLEKVDATNKDFLVLKRESTGGRPTIDYMLKLEIAKEICLVAGASPRANEILKQKSKAYRRYLIQFEERYKNQLPQLSKEDKAWLEIHHANQDANVTLIVNSTVERATKQLNDAWGKVLIRELDGEGRTITLGTLADILNERMNNSCLTTNITNYLVHKGYLKKVRFIKEIEDRFGNIIYKEEKNCHNQPTENFINDFVKTGLAETKEIKPNGKILWNFTDRFITYFIDNFIEEFEKSLGQTSEEYLLEMEGDISE